ncbi:MULTISPECIES: hypothetical protein [Methylobacterium]|jgi:hypothetical protein|uniref:hypothetical protein n=1 Tax=Methylobacterium TaxID=407 RepID=UPI0008E0DC16|nr:MULTISPECIES: hypothetical protein [Methylobacterium]MBZ6415322.1 hypothetical protein [Methylobacterium sp.]MBK3396137.1 hypothetical protein [Methylobacterium ajmalii]MBK3406821.1 hypothetical protein [Methylobacterium ajmalii]MBK3425515.1 hypothetical protein [Methylobacterium ajmalii]SFE81379.1 hypothetical protein SAMN04487844_10678 [Methylobacterium sp. yr596]
MDWFERLTGFRETEHAPTQRRLRVENGCLVREGSGDRFAVGTLTLPSVAELRAAASGVKRAGRTRLSLVEGDVRALHRLPGNRGALFQVASQFNMLEMVGPGVTPEDGVARYAGDRTQGPACAMAAGAATIYRNYLVPVEGGLGQTAGRQLDGLADLGDALARSLGTVRTALWAMRNGYALPTRAGLAAIAAYLDGAGEDARDDLRGRLRLGLHTDVAVTDGPSPHPLVSQVFCSALPVAYAGLPQADWAPFARLVLEAAYEGTLLAGLLNAARGASGRVLLTRLGGGAFGNADDWIDAALLRALRLAGDGDLDVALVSYGPPAPALHDLVRRYAEPGR